MVTEKLLDPIEWYYQDYPEERDMSEAYFHRSLAFYIYSVLEWRYRTQVCVVTSSLVIYNRLVRTSPDVALIKNAWLSYQEKLTLRGWLINSTNRPAPAVVFEITSHDNWPKDIDLDKNPQNYLRLGAGEYFAFDPVGYWPGDEPLRGWRYVDGQIETIEMVNGRLRSEELDAYLVADGEFLRIEDEDGTRWLTQQEVSETTAQIEARRAEQEAFRAQQEALRADREAKRAQVAQQRADRETKCAEIAQKKAEQETLRAQDAQQRAEAEAKRAQDAQQRAEQEAERVASLEAELENLRAKLREQNSSSD